MIHSKTLTNAQITLIEELKRHIHFVEAYVMAGNELALKEHYIKIMEEKERSPGLHFFNLGPNGDCTNEQVIRIRQLFINQLKQDTCLECCRCHALLAKVVFVEEERDSFCISCFEKEPELMEGAFMFVNLNLDDPSFGDEWIWKYSEELQLVYKAHEMGVEDMALLANSMTLGKRTTQDIRDYFYIFGGFKPRQPKAALSNAPVLEKKEEVPVKKRKETYLQLFTRLKNILEELDSGMLYYLMSQLHDRTDTENKQHLLKEFVKIINFREQFYPFLEKVCREYMGRKYSISSSSSQSVSDSYKPEEDKRRKKEIATKTSKLAKETKEANEKEEKRKSIRTKEKPIKAIKARAPKAKSKQTKTRKISRKTNMRKKLSSFEKKKPKGFKKLLKKQPLVGQRKKAKLIIESQKESD